MPTRDPIVACLGRYLAVGALNTLIDIGLFVGLSTGLGFPTLAANTLSYSAGIVNGYVLNRRWTYGDGKPIAPRALGEQLAQFTLVSLVALLINTVAVSSLTPALSTLTSPAAGAGLAKAVATGLSLGWNFLLNHFWTFRTPAVPASQAVR